MDQDQVIGHDELLKRALQTSPFAKFGIGDPTDQVLLYKVERKVSGMFEEFTRQTGSLTVTNIGMVTSSEDGFLQTVMLYVNLRECYFGPIRYLGWDERHGWHFRLSGPASDKNSFLPCYFEVIPKPKRY